VASARTVSGNPDRSQGRNVLARQAFPAHARLAPLLAGAALAACSSQADRELEAVKSARSVLAEWALVEEQDGKGHTPSVYADQMREQAREELKTSQSELESQQQAAALIEQVRNGSPDEGALQRADDALEPLEDSLESS
jgi:hypothetical protein